MSNQYRKPWRIQVPKEWEITRLEEITERITKGTTPTTYGYNYVDEGVNFIKIESINDQGNFLEDFFAHISQEVHEKLARSKMQEDDLLVTIAGNLGRVAIVTKDILPANTNQAIAIVRLNNSRNYNLKFIFYYLKGTSIKKYIQLVSTTGAQPNLSLKQVGDFEIALPPSHEQNKIADILSNVDEAINKTEAIIKQTKILKKGLLQQLLIKGIRNTKYKQSEIGEIPEDWEVVNLSKLLDVLKDGTHNPPKKVEQGVPMLSALNIKNNKVEIENNDSFISEEDYNKMHKSYEISEGDVLLTIVGTLGRSAVVKKEHGKFTVQRSVAILRPKNTLLPLFLNYFTQSNYFQNELQRRSNTTAQSGIYLKELGSINIPLPDVKEQKKIVSILLSIDGKLNYEEKRINKLKDLKMGLMQVLLTGEVRVKVNDEEV
ncbi:restriction endonuclease subunit S [Fredinandcohnia sp. QZ13]|uniref:restriction endonuclease subunit S n=1 Tax=Fredinandcohnia sp. QZ13 TaxID=3073144 RepID=UPI0028534026|nr:restriction endonuclease subunit S [Fredinandcohnia sp. QZ13]MDR4886312.1 restriction endonuclease subunit S [Fredinandcohnia sp. QZ13]